MMHMRHHISRVCQMAYCQLRSIAIIRRSITTAACRTIVHALVMSRLEYCNAVLYGLPDTQLQKLQLVQNSAAPLVTGTPRWEHITPVLFALHWLPIRQRIQFKLLLLVYRCTHQLAPVYLTDLVVPYVPARSLHSADQNLLTVKRYNLERYGRRSFSVAGPSFGTPCHVLFGILFLYLLSGPVLKLTFFAKRLSLYCRSHVNRFN